MVDRELSGRLSSAPQRRRALEAVWCAILSIIAVAVFGDGLSRHLHSDDWVILERVRPDGWRTVARWFAFEGGHAWGFRPTLFAMASLTRLFGEGWPQHAASLLLHVVASILVFTVVRGGVAADPAARRRTDRIWPAAVASLVFLLHPTNDEAVYWFAAIVYPLAATLGLAYWLLSVSAVPGARVGSWVALAMALLAHPAAAVFPLTRFLIPARRGASRVGPGIATLFAGTFLLLLVTRGGPAGNRLPAPGGQTVEALSRLAALAAWPFGPSVLSLVLLAAVVALVVVGFLRGDRVGPAGLTVLLGTAALSAFAFPGVEAHRYVYLPALGLAISLGALWSGPAPGKLASLGLAVFLLARGAGVNGARATAWNAAGALGDRVVEALLPALPAAGPVVLAGAPDTLDGVWVLRHGLAERIGTAHPGVPVTDLRQRYAALLDPSVLTGKVALLFDGEGWRDVSSTRRGPCLSVLRAGQGDDGFVGEERVLVRMEAGPKRLLLFARGHGELGEPAILEVRFAGRPAGSFRTTDGIAPYRTTVVATGGEDVLELRIANDLFDAARRLDRNLWVELAVLECP